MTQTEHDEYEPYPRLDLNAIVARVRAAGEHAEIMHTGGNTATIYVGTTRPNDVAGEPDWYEVCAGPGYFENGRRQAWAWTDEFNVGPDRDPDTIDVGDMISPTNEDEAVQAILQALATERAA